MLHKCMYRSSHFVIALVLSQTKNTQAHCTHLWTHRAITHTCAHALDKEARDACRVDMVRVQMDQMRIRRLRQRSKGDQTR